MHKPPSSPPKVLRPFDFRGHHPIRGVFLRTTTPARAPPTTELMTSMSATNRILIVAAVVALTSFHTSAEISIGAKVELTSYPTLANACLAFITGYKSQPGSSKLIPTLGHAQGSCGPRKALIVTVTHENTQNNHKGSTNYSDDISGYVGDFDYDKDYGRWLRVQIIESEPPRIAMDLDTADFPENNVTGWPLQYGHLFLGLNDQTVVSSLDRSISVDFDLKVRTAKPSGKSPNVGFNGRRILLGAQGIWTEAPLRTNTTHFLEVDISQTPGYSESYHQPQSPLCKDVKYDRCFYGDGRFAEGREVSLQTALAGPDVPDTSDQWTHIQVPLSALFQKLKWVSPPNSWGSAKLQAIYIAIESTGATSTKIEVKDYHVTGTPLATP